MKSVLQAQPKSPVHHAEPEPGWAAGRSREGDGSSASPRLVAQAALGAAVHTSPRMQGQRTLLARLFGPAAQRRPRPQPASLPPVAVAQAREIKDVLDFIDRRKDELPVISSAHLKRLMYWNDAGEFEVDKGGLTVTRVRHAMEDAQ